MTDDRNSIVIIGDDPPQINHRRKSLGDNPSFGFLVTDDSEKENHDRGEKRTFQHSSYAFVNKRIRRRKWRLRPKLKPPFKLDTLEDLLYIAWNYQGNAFDWFVLWNLIPPLMELNRLVGMKKLKQGVMDMIIYHIQGLHITRDMSGEIVGDGDNLHTVLYGLPGTGKTSSAHILAKIYCRMGLLSTENVIVAKRSDLVGKWIGHSEDKTKKIMNSALGGVLFIDEAYSMGHATRTDSFAKAAIDLINQFLSEHKGEFICIIAGYEEELETCFFSINRGLSRRFPWRFKIDPYTPEELCIMFKRKVQKERWGLEDDAVDVELFETNKDFFPAFGGDIDNFFTSCKTSHSRRIFGLTKCQRRLLSRVDVKKGLESYKAHKDKKKNESFMSMYT